MKNDMGTWRKLNNMTERKEERINIELNKKETEEMITNIKPAVNRVCEHCKKTHIIDGVFVLEMVDNTGDTGFFCTKCAIEASEIEDNKE